MRGQELQFQWDGNFPEELKESILLTVVQYGFIFPVWLRTLRFIFDPELSELAAVDARPQYRDAFVLIGPKFMTEPALSKRETVVHEMCHIVLAPLSSVIADFIEAQDDAVLASMLTDRVETTTSDLCNAVLNTQEGIASLKEEITSLRLSALTNSPHLEA